MEKSQVERIGLWVLVGLNLVGLIILTVVVFGELDTMDQQMLGLAEAQAETPEATPAPTSASTQIAIAGVSVLSDTVAMTVTVRSSGSTGDLLFEPPVLQDHTGRTYPVSGDSLEEARIAFLDLVTRGQTMARLEFAGGLAPTPELLLVFNPGHESFDTLAPRVEAQVPLRMGSGGE